MTKALTKAKAAKILHDKSVRGHRLTARQIRFFGARASGYLVRKVAKRRTRRRYLA